VERTKFWSRVGHWFAGADRATASASADPASPVPNPEGAPPTSSPPDPALIATEGGSGPISKLRASRSSPSVNRLEETYRELAQWMEKIERHLGAQTDHTERIAQLLDRLATGLANVPARTQQQAELLTAIREDASIQVGCAKRVEESVSQLPQIADAQRETMVSIGRQLDLAREASERVAATIAENHEVLGKLGEATNASVKALQEMRWDVSARDAQISALLTEHTKRFTQFAFCAIGLAAIAATIACLALFL